MGGEAKETRWGSTTATATAAGSVAVILALASAAPATLGCETCADGSYCRGVTMLARFRVAQGDLNGGTATVCWRDVCSTATLPDGAFAGPLRSFGSADARPRPLDDGRLSVDFKPYIANDKALELQIANGDRYRFSIRDGRGRVVIDVTREAMYTETERAASSCDDSPCRSVDLVFE